MGPPRVANLKRRCSAQFIRILFFFLFRLFFVFLFPLLVVVLIFARQGSNHTHADTPLPRLSLIPDLSHFLPLYACFFVFFPFFYCVYANAYFLVSISVTLFFCFFHFCRTCFLLSLPFDIFPPHFSFFSFSVSRDYSCASILPSSVFATISRATRSICSGNLLNRLSWIRCLSMFSSLPLRKQLNPGLSTIVAFRGVSTHGLPSFLLHAVDVDLKVARFLLSLIPASIMNLIKIRPRKEREKDTWIN